MSISRKSSLVTSSLLCLTVAMSAGSVLAQGAGERGAGGERGGAGAGTERSAPPAAERPGAGGRGAGTPAVNERPGAGGQPGRPAAAQSEREGAGAREAAPAAGERNGAAERNPRPQINPRAENRGENGNRGPDAAREGARGGHAALTGEKRTRFQSVIRDRRTEVLHGVDFRVGVGTVIPGRYHFYPLPPTLIELVPEYRGYDYSVVENQIVILEPGTRRIVDIIEE